jgi:hypothetical protein
MGTIGALYDFWHAYGSDIENGAVVLSAIAAFAIVRDARRTAKRRRTMDLIVHHETDKELVEERRRFNKIKCGSIRLSSYGKPDHRGSEQARTLRKVLNIHELTAVAIGEGVIDECAYRRWFNRTYITDYEATKGYIAEARKTHGNPRAFSEFEKTALRWQEDESWNVNPGWWGRKAKAIGNLWRA